ncbi:DUF6502 family protein [Oligoflexia bacterium]|nr:DUF6502 family protein [Oligoflexia bacterium]
MLKMPKPDLIKCAGKLLAPVLRFCLRHSLTIQELNEEIKHQYITVAADELAKNRIMVNTSRLSVATGLRRHEVQRIWQGERKDASPGHGQRVVGQWMNDARFLTKAKKPRVLGYKGPDNDFDTLVKLVCTDVPPGTVLFELVRTGVVEKTKTHVKLLEHSHISSDKPIESFQLYAQDSTDLLNAVEENVIDKPKPLNLHVRTEFDNVSQNDLKKIRTWLNKEGNAFHKKALKYLARFDLDINPPAKPEPGGARIVITSFSLVEPNSEPND